MRKTQKHQNQPRKSPISQIRGQRYIAPRQDRNLGNLICGSCGKKTPVLYSKHKEMMCWDCQK